MSKEIYVNFQYYSLAAPAFLFFINLFDLVDRPLSKKLFAYSYIFGYFLFACLFDILKLLGCSNTSIHVELILFFIGLFFIIVSAGFLCCCRHESTYKSNSKTKHKKSSKQPRNLCFELLILFN